MKNTKELVSIFVLWIVTATLLSLLLALPTMFLWNKCLVPAVDHINIIGFWQALGLNFLFSSFFKSTNVTKK
jgi:hypothetical protein